MNTCDPAETLRDTDAGQDTSTMDCDLLGDAITADVTPRGRPVATPAEHHRVQWTIARWGVRGEVTCDAPAGAACRMGCPAGCDEWPCGHDPEDQGRCLVIDWLEADDFADSYAGIPEPLRDGPVELAWNGDGYEWRYPVATVRPNGKRYRPRKPPAACYLPGDDSWGAPACAESGAVLVLRTHDVAAHQAWAERLYRAETGDITPLEGVACWVRLVPWDASGCGSDSTWISCDGNDPRACPAVEYRPSKGGG